MCIFLVLVLFGAACGNPAGGRRPMENPGMFEGDRLGVESVEDRNAVALDSQRWPNGEVPYVLHSSLAPHWAILKKGMDHISSQTCIRFVPRYNQEDYIKMYKGDGCFAHWGRIGGEQTLSLGDGCHDLGTAVHELLHAIGFEHEHNRSDRDDYLTINWNNIEEEWYYAFYKLTPQQNRLLTPFDFDSIMLYEDTAFAKADNLKTMVAKKGGKLVEDFYSKKGMSVSDVTRVKMLYNC